VGEITILNQSLIATRAHERSNQTGVFFVIPLRKYYIVHQKLTFPTPAATAYTIRSLHNGKTGAVAARKKSLALLYTFVTTFVFKVISGYAPGIVRPVMVITFAPPKINHRCTTGTSAGLSSDWDSPASFRWTTMVGSLNVRCLFTRKAYFSDNRLASSHSRLLRCRHAQWFERQLEFL